MVTVKHLAVARGLSVFSKISHGPGELPCEERLSETGTTSWVEYPGCRKGIFEIHSFTVTEIEMSNSAQGKNIQLLLTDKRELMGFAHLEPDWL